MKPTSAQALFLRGQYLSLAQTELDQASQYTPLDQAFFVGALSFVGRLLEAQAFSKSKGLDNEKPEGVIVRFFFAIAKARASDYREAQTLLLKNIRWLRKNTSNKLTVDRAHAFASTYVFQGLGFYRHLSCRYKHSLKWAERAYIAARFSQDPIGQILASDLMGHSCIQARSYTEGKEHLLRAQALCHKYDNRSLADTLEVSLLCYQAQFSARPDLSEKKISIALKQINPQDTYSLANLLLELARVQTLQGHVQDAFKTLDKAYSHIGKKEYNRQKALYFFRSANLYRLQANSAPTELSAQYLKKSFLAIDSALALLNPSTDQSLRLGILGLKLSLSPRPRANLKKEVEQLTLSTQSAIGARILRRQKKSIHLGSEKRRQDDKLGNCIDEWTLLKQNDPNQGVKQKSPIGAFNSDLHFIFENHLGYFLGPFFKKSGVFLNLIPKKIVILAPPLNQGSSELCYGDSFISNELVSPLIDKLFTLLSEGSQTKATLTQKLYGFSYHSLRHDPMLYALIFRARKLLGQAAGCLESTQEGYAWNDTIPLHILSLALPKRKAPSPGINLGMLNSPRGSQHNPGSKTSGSAALAPSHGLTQTVEALNWRQIKAIEWLNTKGQQNENSRFLTSFTYSTQFKVSQVQASRDLSQLVSLGLLQRIGKARASTYFLSFIY